MLKLNRFATPLLLFTALVAFTTIGLSVNRFINALRVAVTPAIREITNQQLENSALPNTQAIAQRSWFGLAPEDKATPSSAPGALAGKYELKGISAAAQNETFSGAFIAEKGQPEVYYRISETLAGHDGVLDGVFKDYVTIRQGSALVDLHFPGAAVDTATNQPEIPAGKAAYFYLPADEPAPPEPSLSDLTKQFIADPEKLLAQAGLKPVILGQNQGYLFNGEDSQGVFEDTHLQKGDVILSVNGAEVGDMKGDRLLLPKLMTAQSLDLQIKRGDQTITLPYKMP